MEYHDMVSTRHHRCNLCGRGAETGKQVEDDVDRRNPKEDLYWWVVAEDSTRDLRFER